MDEVGKSVAGGAGDSLSQGPGAPGVEIRCSCQEGLPENLRRRLDASAAAWNRSLSGRERFPAAPSLHTIRGAERKRWRRGWYAAAACLVLAVAGWWPSRASLGHGSNARGSPEQAEVERAREQLLASGSPHLGRWAWSNESGVEAELQGDVVWDGERQEGYVRLSGLAPNGGSDRQYQLWIFDASRDDRYPVDGGVFDMPQGSSTITVPIRPLLTVSHPVAFAVTSEPAGGVVVSDRRHLVAVARSSGF